MTEWSEWVVVQDWTWDPAESDYYKIEARYRYDYFDPSHVCDSEQRTVWREYELCDEMTGWVLYSVGPWVDVGGGVEERAFTYVRYDAHDPAHIFATKTETERRQLPPEGRGCEITFLNGVGGLVFEGDDPHFGDKEHDNFYVASLGATIHAQVTAQSPDANIWGGRGIQWGELTITDADTGEQVFYAKLMAEPGHCASGEDVCVEGDTHYFNSIYNRRRIPNRRGAYEIPVTLPGDHPHKLHVRLEFWFGTVRKWADQYVYVGGYWPY